MPAALTLYLGFSGGGFFAGTTAQVAVVLAILALLRVTLAAEPFAGLGPMLALGAGALGLYAVWCLLSAEWSDAPARAMIEFDRALLYWLALLLFGSLPRRPERVDSAIRAMAIALLVVCGAGLVSRVLPEVIPVETGVANERLGYPLTYWNALGLLAAFGAILSVHLTSSFHERVAVRAVAAAAVPVFVATLYFTFSRGSIAAGAAGLVLYLALVRPPAAVTGLLATVPPAVLAVLACYQADLLSTDRPTTPGAVDQGQDVALALVGCLLAAALLRMVLARADRRLASIRLSPEGPRATLAAAIGGLVLVLAAAAALGGLGYAERQVDRFVEGAGVTSRGDLRERLTDTGNNGRLENWEVALRDFEQHPLVGTGAGTYAISWAREREGSLKVEDAHSLYLESLSELGLIGAALIAVFVGALIAGLVVVATRRGRAPVYGAVLALAVAWALEAGIDWVWEVPAVTLPVIALGAMCLARPAQALQGIGSPRLLRVVVGVGLLVLAITPALVALSQARLDEGVRAFKRGDCTAAIDSGLSSIGALGVRPEPFFLLGFCDVRLGEDELAIAAMRRAVSLDPENWRSWYGLALAQASAGRDPRAAAGEALRLDPLGVLTGDIAKRFDTDDPRKWKRRAAGARLFSSLSSR